MIYQDSNSYLAMNEQLEIDVRSISRKWECVLLIAALLFYSACANSKKASGIPQLKEQSAFKSKKGKRAYLNAYDKTLTTLWGVPFEEVDVKTFYGSAHVIISGPTGAPPLLLLHGLNASSTMWYPNAKVYSEKYRVYCIDFILEPGKSTSTGKIKNADDLVNWYDDVFDQLKLEKFSIVGASRGGWIAMQLAMHSKKKITKIALLSPAQAFTWIKPKTKILQNIFFEFFPKRERLRTILKTVTSNVDKLKQAYIDQYFIAVTKSKKNRSIFQIRPFSDDELKLVHIPVLVLIGDQDIVNGQSSLARAESMIPGVKTGVIKNAGHFLSFDEPEIVNKIVLKFLENQ
jgi:pimeloyl-ACP methyl ester carboxylesterase